MKTRIQPLVSNPFVFANNEVVFAPGRYWVGDPAYVVPNDEWSLFCDALFASNDAHSGFCRENNFFCLGTAYGDGCYLLRENGMVVGSCGVDAGLLSIIPEILVKLWKSEEKYDGVWPYMGGIWIDLKKSAEVEPYGKGNFRFADFDMNTEDEDEFEDEIA